MAISCTKTHRFWRITKCATCTNALEFMQWNPQLKRPCRSPKHSLKVYVMPNRSYQFSDRALFCIGVRVELFTTIENSFYCVRGNWFGSAAFLHTTITIPLSNLSSLSGVRPLERQNSALYRNRRERDRCATLSNISNVNFWKCTKIETKLSPFLCITCYTLCYTHPLYPFV